MIPPAPPLGPQLAADATPLRPLLADAERRYRGIDNSNAAAPVNYLSVVRQSASLTGVGVAEQDFVVLREGSAPVRLENRSGTIYSTEAFDPFKTGQVEEITTIELRSPVYQADQVTLYEKTLTKTGIDIDGDKIEDSGDVAAYSRIIGREDVALADRSVVSAVKLQIYGLVRFKRSSNGTYTDIVQTVQTLWYANSLGLVKRTLTKPALIASAGTTIDRDEVLEGWDGVTTGWGYTSPKALQAPGDGATRPASPLPPVLAAAGLSDRAMVLTASTANTPNAFALSVLDKRGVLTQTREFVNYLTTEQYSNAMLVAVGDGVALLPQLQGFGVVRMLRFDATGAAIGAQTGTALPVFSAKGQPASAAFDGTNMWLAWFRVATNQRFSDDLVVQAFNAKGEAASAPMVLDNGSSTLRWGDVRISAYQGNVMATWGRQEGGVSTLRFAYWSAAQPTPLVKDLASSTSVNLQPADATLRPIAGVGNGAMVWGGQLLAGPVSPDTPIVNIQPAGARLDFAGEVLRWSTVSINGESLRSLTPHAAGLPMLEANVGGSLVLTRTLSDQKLYADDTAPSTFIEVSQYSPFGPALAVQVPVRTRIPSGEGNAFDLGPYSARFVVPFADRLLVVGGPEKVVTSIVWKR